MVGSPAPPPPSANSSAPRFETNSSSPNPSHVPSQQTPTSPSARDVVFGIIAELRARGHLGSLEVSTDEISEKHAPALFSLVVAAYMAETGGRSTAVVYPIPPPPIASGQSVELLRLYLAVRSRGGFSTVSDNKSWEAVAMDIGLDPSARPEVELMYGEYIAPLEIFIRDTKVVDVRDGAGQRLDSPPALSGSRKRKMAGTLNWLRMVAKSPDEAGILKPSSGGHVNRVLQLRHQMCANIDCKPLTNWKTLTGMLDWVRHVATSPDEPGVIREDFGKNFATAVQVRNRMFAADEMHGLPSVEITECDVWDEKTAAHLGTHGISGRRTPGNGQADIPEWTGQPSLLDEDPDALRFLGEPIWTPEESNADLIGGSIGKGRQDGLEGPDSMNSVRSRVEEKRSALKHELGPAFSKMGLDRMGEDVALTWTMDEEMRFHTTIQRNRYSSKLWERLLAAFAHSKSREDIVSYYYNVYLVRVKARQNWLAPNAARRDDEPLA